MRQLYTISGVLLKSFAVSDDMAQASAWVIRHGCNFLKTGFRFKVPIGDCKKYWPPGSIRSISALRGLHGGNF